jgi:hypothetical protein
MRNENEELEQRAKNPSRRDVLTRTVTTVGALWALPAVLCARGTGPGSVTSTRVTGVDFRSHLGGGTLRVIGVSESAGEEGTPVSIFGYAFEGNPKNLCAFVDRPHGTFFRVLGANAAGTRLDTVLLAVGLDAVSGPVRVVNGVGFEPPEKRIPPVGSPSLTARQIRSFRGSQTAAGASFTQGPASDNVTTGTFDDDDQSVVIDPGELDIWQDGGVVDIAFRFLDDQGQWCCTSMLVDVDGAQFDCNPVIAQLIDYAFGSIVPNPAIDVTVLTGGSIKVTKRGAVKGYGHAAASWV